MTLPASGPISLLNLQDEFGGTNPIAFNEYYRGGVNVSSALTQIPTSGAIDLNAFHGISTSLKQGAKLIKQSSWGGKFSYVNGTWIWGEVISNQGYKYTSSDLKTRVTDVSNLGGLNGSAAESIPRGCIFSYENGLIAAIVSGSTVNEAYICTSSDGGSTWVGLANPTPYAGWVAVTAWPLSGVDAIMAEGTLYGSRTIVAFGYSSWVNGSKTYRGSSSIVSTDNGLTWSIPPGVMLPAISNTSTLAVYPTVNCATFCPGLALAQGGDGLFIAGANDALYSAPDGVGYTKRYAYAVDTGSVVTGTLSYVSSAFGNGTYVAGRSNSGRITTSTDGVNFYQQLAVPNLAGVQAIGFGNGYFVMVGTTTLASPNNNAIWTSTDGISWVFNQQIGISAVTAARIVFAGGRFYVQMSDGSAWAANA